jgi:hypothetical protein
LNITTNGVLTATSNTTTASGIAGTAITAGQALYLDTTSFLRPAAGSVLAQAQAVVGIALNSPLGSAEPVTYATAGDIVLPTSGASTTLVGGSVYVLGPAAGAIVAANDTAAGTASFISLLGVATSATTLRLSIAPLGAVR